MTLLLTSLCWLSMLDVPLGTFIDELIVNDCWVINWAGCESLLFCLIAIFWPDDFFFEGECFNAERERKIKTKLS